VIAKSALIYKDRCAYGAYLTKLGEVVSNSMGSDAKPFCKLRIRDVPSHRRDAEDFSLNVQVVLIAHRESTSDAYLKADEHKGVFTVTL
jgi:hypothetical protein